jgi:hypothetical protein
MKKNQVFTIYHLSNDSNNKNEEQILVAQKTDFKDQLLFQNIP